MYSKDGCIREKRSGLVWHTAEEGRRSCGKPDFHFGTAPYHGPGERDNQRHGYLCQRQKKQKGRRGWVRGAELLKATGDFLQGHEL